MQSSLVMVGLLVLIFWGVIMALYLVTSRKQVSIEATIEDLERELDERAAS